MRITFFVLMMASLVGCEKEIEEVDLGSYVTDTGGLTGEMPIEIPEGTKSALVYCGPYGYGYLGTAWKITSPNGAIFYTNQYHESHTDTPMRVGNHRDMLPILMPVSPDHDISAGEWLLDVWIAAGKEPVEVNCSGVFSDTAPSIGTVDINAILVGVENNEAAFATVFETLDSIWSSAGLSVGNVTYETFSGDADAFSIVNADSQEFGTLLSMANPDSDTTLNVFFVEEVTSDDGATIVGLSAGPPGLATVHGTTKSGLVVSSIDLVDNPTYIAQIVAHEGAHFMGLFHTSEKDGGTHDPLSDTEQCTSDDNGDGLVSPTECASNGGDNLMFWAPPEGAVSLTEDQSWVLRRNPVVQ